MSSDDADNELNIRTMTPNEIAFEMKYPIKRIKGDYIICPLCGGKYTKKKRWET